MVNTPSPVTLRARWIVPGDGPPIHGGRITLFGERVLGVSTAAIPGERDLGDVAVLPGWVNPHTHLEFSALDAPLGRAGMALPDWLTEVVRRRTGEDSPEGRRSAIFRGVAESEAAGVRLLGEIATAPWEAARESPSLPCKRTGERAEPRCGTFPDSHIGSEGSGGMEIVAMREVLGLAPARQEQTLAWALQAPPPPEGCRWALSPHAPYTTPPPLVERCVRAARERGWMVAMHLAESSAEQRLLTAGDGPLAEMLRQLDAWQDGWFPAGRTVDDLVRLLCTAPRALIIHGNYLSEEAIRFLATEPQASVVYCPRTHAYFDHPRHPVASLLEAGVRVALGTDSRASNPDLNPWGEVQYLLRHRTDLPPEAVLRMATSAAADALGRGDLGRIRPGCRPGLMALPSTAESVEDLWEQMRLADRPPQVLRSASTELG